MTRVCWRNRMGITSRWNIALQQQQTYKNKRIKFLSWHLQTAQDVSFANVQGLFRALSARQTRPSAAAEPSGQESVGARDKGGWDDPRGAGSRFSLRLKGGNKREIVSQIWCVWTAPRWPSCPRIPLASCQRNRNTPTSSTPFIFLPGFCLSTLKKTQWLHICLK